MKKYIKIIYQLFTLLFIVGTLQLTTSLNAFAADPPSDLRISVGSTGHDRTFSYNVCNDGPTDVIALSVETTFTNFTVSSFFVSSYEGNATTPGVADLNTGDWTGLLANTECVAILVFGTITGSVGDTNEFTATITSSTLADSSINVDTDPLDDTSTMTSSPSVPFADIALDTTLLTSNITIGTNIFYELIISSVGPNDYIIDPLNAGDHPSIYFLMPDGATFTNIIDTNTGDVLDKVVCNNVGDIQSFGPQMAQYSGDVIACSFNINSGLSLPTGSSYSFQLELQATSSFVSGTTQVRGLLAAGDPDTAIFFEAQVKSQDFFSLQINNMVNLTFDATDLIATINPCAGQGEVIDVNDACFTISFNKLINGSTFTQEDLVLSGGGNIASFIQNNSNLWTVRVNGMTLGSTLTVTLKPGEVKDRSAISNGVQVLGENRVRYGTVIATAQALPETGKNIDWLTPITLLLFGMILIKTKQFKYRIKNA